MSFFKDIILTSPKSIFVLYLIISGNFLANLFGCRILEALNSNMWLKHLLGFMTLYFFVVLVDSKSKWSDSPHIQLGFSFIFYCIFVITTRMDYKWWIALIIGLCAIYILQVYKEHDTTDKDSQKLYEQIQLYIIFAMILIIIFGFIIYYGRKKVEYGADFDNMLFLLGKTECAFNREPIKLNDFQAFKKAFSQ